MRSLLPEWRTLHEPRAFEFASSESLHNQRRLFGAAVAVRPAAVDILEFRGMARVVVDGRYSYETDPDLEVGDEVLLPPSGLGGQWGRKGNGALVGLRRPM